MSMDIFDITAPLYHLLEHIFLSREHVIDRIDGEDKKILDVGGGTGHLLEKLPRSETYLLDGSRKMIEQSSLKKNRVIGRAGRNPFASESFDIVLCIDALHHFDNKEASLEEMVRVLKPGGEVIILEFDPHSIVTRSIEFAERAVLEPSSFFEIPELVGFFRRRGFETSVYRLNSYEYILSAVKPEHSSSGDF